jgi:hypothetical protein
MISNERPATGGPPRSGPGEKAGIREETIKTEKIQIERKTFVFALKENPRGRFLRITEDVGGRRDTIIVPAPGLGEFRRVLDEMIKLEGDKPASGPEEPAKV